MSACKHKKRKCVFTRTVQYLLKTSLFEAKLCYDDFKRLFLLQKPRNLGHEE